MEVNISNTNTSNEISEIKLNKIIEFVNRSELPNRFRIVNEEKNNVNQNNLFENNLSTLNFDIFIKRL